MSSYRIILFDLDGTLSDPKTGITKSVQYALEKMGITEPDLDKLEPFIGPPLMDSFAAFYQMSVEDCYKAVDLYREYFKVKGMFENVLYPEIPALLRRLKQEERTIVVATSKPTVFSEQILQYFEIDHLFERIVGSNLDGTRTAKAEIIRWILDQFPDFPKDDFIMIGDRKYDILGAGANGIASIGVTYGYGSREELQEAGAVYLADSLSEVEQILLNTK